MFRRDVDDDLEALQRPTDYMLRQAGFKIHDRPRDAEAVWSRNGHTYHESEAWYLLNEEAVRKR